MGCSCGTYENLDEVLDNPMDRVGESKQWTADKEKDVEPEGEASIETKLPETQVERDAKHLFTIKFKKKPLGVILTSQPDGKGAYVTKVDKKANKAVKKNKLPLKSKLLKVNDSDVELQYIDDITELIVESLKKLPMTLTFCHPEGLNKDEFA